MKAWWRTEEEPSAQSRVGATHRPTDGQQPQRVPLGTIRPRRARPRPGRGGMLFVVLFAIGIVGFPALITITALRSIDDPSGTSGFGSVSHDGPSLVGRERFAQALEKVREEAGSEASLVALRLDPKRLSAVVRRSDGSGAVVTVLPDLDASTFPSGAGGDRGLSLNRIDPAAPTRIVRAAAERLRVAAGDVNYLALAGLSRSGGGGIWSVFFKAGQHATADLDGSNVRVPGS